MRIAARFPGTCPTCSLPIAMGDAVEWTKGAKATHSSCPAALASKPAAPSYVSTTGHRGSASSDGGPRFARGGSGAPVTGYSSYCTGRAGCGCFDCE